MLADVGEVCGLSMCCAVQGCEHRLANAGELCTL